MRNGRWLIVFLGLGLTSNAPAQPDVEPPAERIHRFQAMAEFCQADTALVMSALGVLIVLDDLESLVTGAYAAAEEYPLMIVSLEPYDPDNPSSVPKIGQEAIRHWRLLLMADMGWARPDDGLADPGSVAPIERRLVAFETALYGRWMEAKRQIVRQPNGSWTIAFLHDQVVRIRCEAALAQIVLSATSHPGVNYGLIVEDASLNRLLEILAHYPIPRSSTFHSSLLDQK